MASLRGIERCKRNEKRATRAPLNSTSPAAGVKNAVESPVRFDGTTPPFAAYQADAWSDLKPEVLIELISELEREYPQLQFVPADHYFELQREARE